MSKYLDNKELFMEPNVMQHGSHMVMTNVYKPPKKKYTNIDSRFRDDYEFSNTANYIVSLPERINDVRSISVKNIELPKTFYNISNSLGNNAFRLIMLNSNKTIVLPDGQYDEMMLTTALNDIFQALGDPYNGMQFSIVNKFSTFTVTNGHSAVIDFSINSSGESNTDIIRFKLGWLLGFIYPIYILSPAIPSITGPSFVDLNGPRYLYLIADEYSGKGNQQSMTCLLKNSSLSKNILARIAMDNDKYPFGTILVARSSNGLLLSDTRDYNGKIDIQRLNIQLVNEIGNLINLNGQDFSFALEIVYE